MAATCGRELLPGGARGAAPRRISVYAAPRRAARRLDVRVFWILLRSTPAAEAAAGEVEEAQADVRSGIARLNDLRDAGEGKLGEALRPLYIDYLAQHAPKRARTSSRSGAACGGRRRVERDPKGGAHGGYRS